MQIQSDSTQSALQHNVPLCFLQVSSDVHSAGHANRCWAKGVCVCVYWMEATIHTFNHLCSGLLAFSREIKSKQLPPFPVTVPVRLFDFFVCLFVDEGCPSRHGHMSQNNVIVMLKSQVFNCILYYNKVCGLRYPGILLLNYTTYMHQSGVSQCQLVHELKK